MRTAEERIEELHHRADKLEQRRVGRQAAIFGGISAVLLAALVITAWRISGGAANLANETFAGASLLDSSAGGYVLAAVIAFFVGVIITVIIFRFRKRKR